MLPNKNTEVENDKMSMNWKSMAVELEPPGVDTPLPGSNLPGCITAPPWSHKCHLVNYHCISEHWEDFVDLPGARVS